jgi:hypothetical protein
MMLRSWSNTLVSVRQVAQRNAGRTTAGIDGRDTPQNPGLDSACVELRPVRYQFGQGPWAVKGWDANWLVIQGDIRMADQRRWSFTDPCLTTWEARSLGAWLRKVAAGSFVPTAPDDPTRLKEFTEPNLAFGFSGQSTDQFLIRVHLSLEATPPWLETTEINAFYLTVTLGRSQLLHAADDWDRELVRFHGDDGDTQVINLTSPADRKSCTASATSPLGRRPGPGGRVQRPSTHPNQRLRLAVGVDELDHHSFLTAPVGVVHVAGDC